VWRRRGGAGIWAPGTWGGAAPTRASCSAAVTTQTCAGPTTASRRRTVAARRLSSAWAPRARSCLGFRRREAGQRRVPPPPASTTAWSMAEDYLKKASDLRPQASGSGSGSDPEPEARGLLLGPEARSSQCSFGAVKTALVQPKPKAIELESGGPEVFESRRWTSGASAPATSPYDMISSAVSVPSWFMSSVWKIALSLAVHIAPLGQPWFW